MILVCPSCDAKFKVPDGAIPAEGRTVRCAKCKNSWHAKPTDIMRKQTPKPRRVVRQAVEPGKAKAPSPAAVPFDGELDAKAAADAAALRRSVRGALEADMNVMPQREGLFDEGVGDEAGPEGLSEDAEASDDFGISASLKEKFGDELPDTDDDDEAEADDFEDDGDYADEDYDEEEYDEDDFLARRRANQRRQYERESVARQRKLMAAGGVGLILFWVSVFYVFVFERENMQHYFPGTSQFVYGMFDGDDYADRFRPGEGERLTPSPALAEVYIRVSVDRVYTETRSGQLGLVVEGYVENAGTTGAHVPQVRAAIVDATSKELDVWTINPPGLILRRGQRLQFEDFRTPIPVGAKETRLEVLEGTKSQRDTTDN